MTADIPHYREAHGAFLSKLGKGGYAEKVETIVQRPYPDPFSMRNAVRKLVAERRLLAEDGELFIARAKGEETAKRFAAK